MKNESVIDALQRCNNEGRVKHERCAYGYFKKEISDADNSEYLESYCRNNNMLEEEQVSSLDCYHCKNYLNHQKLK